MKKRSQFKIVCFLITIMLIMSCCFVGCGTDKTSSSQVETTITTTVAPTTQQNTTVAPTTVKPTEIPETTEKVEEFKTDEKNDILEDNDLNEEKYESENNDSNESSDIESYNDSINNEVIYSPSEFMNSGVINWSGYQWTYYSELILPGEGLDIPGRHITADGYVCDGDGYVVLAADLSMLPRYSVVDTPFGYTGKVYDTGCAYGTLDVYVSW